MNRGPPDWIFDILNRGPPDWIFDILNRGPTDWIFDILHRGPPDWIGPKMFSNYTTQVFFSPDFTMKGLQKFTYKINT